MSCGYNKIKTHEMVRPYLWMNDFRCSSPQGIAPASLLVKEWLQMSPVRMASPQRGRKPLAQGRATKRERHPGYGGPRMVRPWRGQKQTRIHLLLLLQSAHHAVYLPRVSVRLVAHLALGWWLVAPLGRNALHE